MEMQVARIAQVDRGIVYSILSVMPSIGSVWGLVFYSIFTYCITFCIVGGINYWANKNIDVNQMIKERVTEQRRKLDQRQKKFQQVYKQSQKLAEQSKKAHEQPSEQPHEHTE